MDALLTVVSTINSYLSDYVLVALLIGIGLFYSFKTSFVQVRCFGEGMRLMFSGFSLSGAKHDSGMSSFQALATAIAAQVGTGNIVGASGAILAGGPGAIFWMWVIAFFGMATIYAEAVVAQETRIKNSDGSIAGGPVYYITRAFSGGTGKFLAGFFALAAVIVLGFTGNMVQCNSITSTCATAFGIPSYATGIFVTVLVGAIFIGGTKSLAAVTEKMVPFMAGAYILGGIVILFARAAYLGEAIGLIFKYAFAPQAIIGGSFGAALKIAVSQGAKRGLFSNEAGMGTTPHAHAQANVPSPHHQGCTAMIGVFIDTFVVLTMTALVVISVFYVSGGELSQIGGAAAHGIDKTNVGQLAFGSVFGTSLGNSFVAVCLFFFAFSTILSWSFFGLINAQYLFGLDAKKVYFAITLIFIFCGSLASNDLVWEISDMFNQLMVLPNVMALFALCPVVQRSIQNSRKMG